MSFQMNKSKKSWAHKVLLTCTASYPEETDRKNPPTFMFWHSTHQILQKHSKLAISELKQSCIFPIHAAVTTARSSDTARILVLEKQFATTVERMTMAGTNVQMRHVVPTAKVTTPQVQEDAPNGRNKSPSWNSSIRTKYRIEKPKQNMNNKPLRFKNKYLLGQLLPSAQL